MSSPIKNRSRSRSPLRTNVPRHVPQVQFAIIHYDMFSGTGIPRRALLQALAQLWDQGVKIAYLNGYHYESDPMAERMNVIINQGNPLTSSLRQDISMASIDMMSKLPQNTKILCTLGSPCTKISKGTLLSKSQGEFVGPHVHPSNLVWAAQGAIINCAHRNESNEVIISVAEMVPPAAPVWKLELTAAFGQPVRMETHLLEAATRDRDFYLSPQTTTISHPFSHRSARQFPNGDIWAPVDTNQLQPPTVRSIYPKLLMDVAQGSASPTDTRTIGQFRVQSPTGSFRFAKPQHLAWWMGLPLEIIGRICREFPCEPDPIHDSLCLPRNLLHSKFHTGYDAYFSPCGTKVLCKNCTIAADLIGRAWNFDVAKSILFSVLLQTFSTPSPTFHNYRSLAPHFCGPECPCKVTISQLKK